MSARASLGWLAAGAEEMAALPAGSSAPPPSHALTADFVDSGPGTCRQQQTVSAPLTLYFRSNRSDPSDPRRAI